ncbi:hypothetical protein EJP02_138 [Escherichia phage EJP2]|nr:hypothetical protein EJP02_138 [Escherichia phage EJP2]
MVPYFYEVNIMNVNTSTERLKIYETLERYLDIDEVSPQYIIDILQKHVDNNPGKCLVCYCNEDMLEITASHLETDEEYNARQNFIQQQQERKETEKHMKALMKKSSLSTEEKALLIKYIEENK